MLAIDDSIVYSKSMSTILLSIIFLNYRTHVDCHDTQRIISFVERFVREYGFMISYFVLFAIYVRSEEAKAFMFRVLYM